MRVCVDSRDHNNATPKDIYPMPIADLLIDAAAGHVLSFMDGTAGYHQIPVAEEDRHKTAFRCPDLAGVRKVHVLGDSLLVVNQLAEKFKCLSSSIEPYLRKTFAILDKFADVFIEHIPREYNFTAIELAQITSGLSLRDGVRERLLKVERRTLSSFIARGQYQADLPEVTALDPIDEDWRQPFIDYLKSPHDVTHSWQTRFLALNFVLRNGELRLRGEDGNNFRCVYVNDAKCLMREHKFTIVATDFFTKWVEVEPLKVTSADSMCNFIFRNIISRFGIPECIVTDRGAAFMADSVVKFLNNYGIKLLHSTPYYTQSNGQAEASNKVILGILQKMLEINPCVWHEELYHTLWAYRTSKRGPTDTTPYGLMYGHDVVLPLEINIASLRVQE
ncbi:PREDICTED: uncharacterized protein LOC101313695 [Fragaria vesca subsp. vesca]